MRPTLDATEIAIGMGAGKGAGLLLESQADREAYLKLVEEVSTQVAESARKLREIMLPTPKVLKYQRAERSCRTGSPISI